MRSKSGLETTVEITIGPVNKVIYIHTYLPCVIYMSIYIINYLRLQSSLSDTDFIYFS